MSLPVAALEQVPRWLAVSVFVAAFGLVYFDTFSGLVEYWALNDMYSYGYMVPVISGYLIWVRRHHLATLPFRPSFLLGGAVLSAGLLMLVVGRAASVNLAEQASLIVSVWGAALLLFGRRVVRSLTFPLAYLVTMVPFWGFLTDRLHWPFQSYSAAVGVAALRLGGLPVLRQGVFIELPNITLEVAEACSGIHYLVAVMCIGVPVTHMFVRNWPKRIFILLSAALIALISNGFRVAMVCLFAYYGIRGANGDVHGPYALARSLVVSGIGFVALFWLIAKFSDRRPESHGEDAVWSWDALRPPAMTGVAAGIALCAAALAFDRWHQIEPVPLRASLASFPTSIGGWESRDASALRSELEQVNFDDRLVRTYVAPGGAEASLFLGYYRRQRQGQELIGQGIQGALNKHGDAVSLRQVRPGIRVREFVARTGSDAHLVSYWYVVNGRPVASDYEAKLKTALGSLISSRNNGAIVVVKTRLSSQAEPEAVHEAQAGADLLIAALWGAAGQYL